MDSEHLIFVYIYRRFLGLALVWAKNFLGFLHEQLFQYILPCLPASISSWNSVLVSDLVRFGETHCIECPKGLEPTTTFFPFLGYIELS